MNPAVQKLLDQLASATEKIGAAAWDQAPLVLADIVRAGIIANAVVVVASLLAIGALAWAWRASERCDDSDDTFMLRVFAVVSGVVAFVFAGVGIVQLLTALYAPRAYVLEWLK